jgi:hypothetical protein
MTSETTPPTSSEHAERFHINLGHPLLRLLFLLFFVRRSNSYVEVGEGVVTVRMGPMFRFSTGQAGVEGVRHATGGRCWAGVSDTPCTAPLG